MKDDLSVWLNLLDGFNGISFWREEVHLGAKFQVQSSSADSIGFGIYFIDARGQWCPGLWMMEWGDSEVTCDLTFLDFFPIV